MDSERNLFERFGGVRPMAEAINEAASTVQSWKTAGRISATKQPLVLEKATELGLDVEAIDVIFPLRSRPDTMGRRTGVEAGSPTDHCARAAGMKRSAQA